MSWHAPDKWHKIKLIDERAYITGTVNVYQLVESRGTLYYTFKWVAWGILFLKQTFSHPRWWDKENNLS